MLGFRSRQTISRAEEKKKRDSGIHAEVPTRGIRTVFSIKQDLQILLEAISPPSGLVSQSSFLGSVAASVLSLQLPTRRTAATQGSTERARVIHYTPSSFRRNGGHTNDFMYA